MSEGFIFFKKLFLDFPKLRLRRVGEFYTGFIKRKASETKQMKWKNSKI